MTESTPPEGQQPLTREQKRQIRRSLTEKILQRAESDPEWRELLIDDPELAMREADFPEHELFSGQSSGQMSEVRGQGYFGGFDTRNYLNQCWEFSYQWQMGTGGKYDHYFDWYDRQGPVVK